MNTFERNLTSLYGDRGNVWLVDLPMTISKIANKYHLSHLQPVNNLSYNYVMSGFQDEKAIILKLGLDIAGLKREAHALKAFADHGTAHLLTEDQGMLLLERAIPGSSLKSYFPSSDDQAIRIACNIMKRLHQALLPEAVQFPHIKDWLQVLDKEWDIPTNYLKKARKLRDHLLATTSPTVLLHGDLHHDNILQNGTDWLVIDPKGVIGDPVNEVWAFINNPREMSAAMILARVDLFSELLNLDQQKILNWCFIQSILSWIWAIEDNLKPSSIWISNILDRLTKR